jgi:hypothetical protein
LALSGTITDNGVITLNGTAPNATVESNLTFNGATLNLLGDGIVRPAATQDGIRLLGRAGGTGNFFVSLATTTLTGNRTLTLADDNTILVAGTMVNTNRSLTINGTTNQVNVSLAGAQSLAANRIWTLSLPQNIHTAATPTFGGLTINGSIGINADEGASSTAVFGNYERLVFNNAFSDVARGPNKITTYNDGSTWIGGMGIHNDTQAYYAGGTHKWYRSTSTTAFTEQMNLDGSGNLNVLGNLVAAQVDTGQGLTEVHLMNQNIRTTDSPTFSAVTLSTTSPITFIGNSASGTFNRSVIYAHQNNTSANTANGIFIERGRITDSASAEIRYLVIGARGGQIQWQVDGLGNTSQTGGLTISADSSTISFSSATGAKTISTGGTTDLALSPGGNVRVKTAGLTGGGALQVGGDVRASGEVFAFSSSDKQLKDNITLISNPIEKIMKIGGYTFDWNDKQTFNSGKDYGVIAQEIEEIMPELVNVNHNGFKAVRYEKITPLLIEAIKEQNSMIKNQKERIDKLEEVIQQILNK